MRKEKTSARGGDEEQPESGAPLYGDVLGLVLSHVPLIDLVPASHVSKDWNRAVASSLSHLTPPKPWLLVHSQATRAPYRVSTLAYDPRSRVWIEILRQAPSVKHASPIRSSHSSLLYALSPSTLSFSSDPLHLTWHHASAPRVWRTDPIVALVGRRVVVAGGACDFEDEPLAVETYDIESHEWSACESMPANLKDSSASAWLSIATNGEKMFISEKVSGVTHSYDPITNTWFGPYELRPDQRIYHSVIGFVNNHLIMIGLIGSAETIGSVKVWKIGGEKLTEFKEIADMPEEMVMILKDDENENCGVSSIAMCSSGEFMYVYNPARPESTVCCEVRRGSGGGCEWGWIENAAVNDRTKMERMVVTCGNVDLRELQLAVSGGYGKFLVKRR